MGRLLMGLSGRHLVDRAHLIMDLYDLWSALLRSSEPVTIETFGRIRGVEDRESADRIFRKVRGQLHRWGIDVWLNHIDGEQLARIELDMTRLRNLLEGEGMFAGRLSDPGRVIIDAAFAARDGHSRRKMEDLMRSEFQVHKLTVVGMEKAVEVSDAFSTFLDELEGLCGKDGRDMAIVRTKLEEASFFVKRAMASKPGNFEALKSAS